MLASVRLNIAVFFLPFLFTMSSLKPAAVSVKQTCKNSSCHVHSHFSPKCPKQRLSGQLILIVFLFVLPGGRASGPHVCTGTAAVPRGQCYLQLNPHASDHILHCAFICLFIYLFLLKLRHMHTITVRFMDYL